MHTFAIFFLLSHLKMVYNISITLIAPVHTVHLNEMQVLTNQCRFFFHGPILLWGDLGKEKSTHPNTYISVF